MVSENLPNDWPNKRYSKLLAPSLKNSTRNQGTTINPKIIQDFALKIAEKNLSNFLIIKKYSKDAGPMIARIAKPFVRKPRPK